MLLLYGKIQPYVFYVANSICIHVPSHKNACHEPQTVSKRGRQVYGYLDIFLDLWMDPLWLATNNL